MKIEERQHIASSWFHELQDNIIRELEKTEYLAAEYLNRAPARFTKKTWKRNSAGEHSSHDSTHPFQDEGGGTLALLKNGSVFEKAGVHFSCVHGVFDPTFATLIPGCTQDKRTFWASGISLIIHPLNPHVPSVHMNTRYIITQEAWFGGGIDLTPMLAPYRQRTHEDTKNFHQDLHNLCNRHDPHFYNRFSKECDDYFFLPHRSLPRGVGGIFFDRFFSDNFTKDFNFVRDVGSSFCDIYTPLVHKRARTPWSTEEEDEQLKTRSLYVEFNLLYDRGTLFGLKTKGNVESILSSMPPRVRFP